MRNSLLQYCQFLLQLLFSSYSLLTSSCSIFTLFSLFSLLTSPGFLTPLCGVSSPSNLPSPSVSPRLPVFSTSVTAEFSLNPSVVRDKRLKNRARRGRLVILEGSEETVLQLKIVARQADLIISCQGVPVFMQVGFSTCVHLVLV